MQRMFYIRPFAWQTLTQVNHSYREFRGLGRKFRSEREVRGIRGSYQEQSNQALMSSTQPKKVQEYKERVLEYREGCSKTSRLLEPPYINAIDRYLDVSVMLRENNRLYYVLLTLIVLQLQNLSRLVIDQLFLTNGNCLPMNQQQHHCCKV